ncbi:hypothetical protein AGOR_G00122230 [Albula goreensis]|uniref:Uncharacterized protein n=1 Tax=Albula goreensis TaxID=1534307 RepID=A0A8T3DFR4_9TELE|nr:hypothetical protein AGOR_G00122230 [Albula goreensis]
MVQLFRKTGNPLGGFEEMADEMDYLECIRFLFDAEQDTMADEAVEADMEDYLEDIRFLFEQDTMDTDDYLEDIRFLFDAEDNDAKGATKVKKVERVKQMLKKIKKGVQKLCGRFVRTVRRGFYCCVSVEE